MLFPVNPSVTNNRVASSVVDRPVAAAAMASSCASRPSMSRSGMRVHGDEERRFVEGDLRFGPREQLGEAVGQVQGSTVAPFHGPRFNGNAGSVGS